MNQKRALGYFLIFAGITLFFLKPILSITGFSIADNLQDVKDIWFYIVGLVAIIIGINIGGREAFFMGRESRLADMVNKSGIDTPELEVVPDTCFIRELYDADAKRVTADMTGRELVLIEQIMSEYEDNIKKGKFPNVPLRYLKSPHVKSKIVRAPSLRNYREMIINAWRDVCNNNRKSRYNEINNILSEADGLILAYAIQRGQNPTLILSDDSHIKFIVPSLNKLYNTRINVYSPRFREYAVRAT